MEFWNLETLWFVLIAVLWLGYFFLEGFDFGVGTLLPFLSRDEVDRRVMVNSIGPVWDANEVWLLVAGGATFAAFPEWYATLFSGFYLALLLILLALIARGVAFEYRGKRDSVRWRAWWDRAIFWGSALPALLWGVAWASILRGTPIDASGEYVGSFFDLLHPYALLGGLMTLSLFTLHGAVFLMLKTSGDITERARRAALRLWWPAAGTTLAFLSWSYYTAMTTGERGVVPDLVPITGLAAVLVVAWLVRERYDGWAFVATGLAILLTMATVFLNLYPRVMVSSIDPDFSLTIFNASSTTYTLTVMSWVALIMTPVVIGYQAWSYWVFRKRVSREQFLAPAAAGEPSGEQHDGS